MTAIANDAKQHIGRPLSVFWVDDDAWYSGRIDDYHTRKGWHIQYDDGEDEWLLSLDENVAFDDSDNFQKVQSDHNIESLDQLGHTSDTFTSEPEINIYSDLGDERTQSLKTGTRASHDFDTTEDFKDGNHSVRSHIARLGSADSSVRRNKNLKLNTLSESFHEAADQTSCKSSSELEDVENLLYRDDTKDDEYGSPASFRSKGEGDTSFERRTERIEDSAVPARCLLILGTIFGASNLPDVNEDETDGKCFFRVLFVEGTGASSMFRCKTPIFSSNVTEDLTYPRWNETSRSFRFEMILSERSMTERPFQLEGQIIVALYRVRGQGGFGFIGQASFEIMELIENGTKISHQDAEARFISGDYSLIDRLDRAMKSKSKVQVSLQIAWCSDSHTMNDSNVSHSSQARPITVKSRRNNENSTHQEEKSINTIRKSKNIRSNGADSSQSRSVFPRMRPSSAAPTSTLSRGPPPVKVVSAQQRKQVEERRRIEAQNKLLHSRLQSKGPKCKGEVVGSIYRNPNLTADTKSPSSNSIGRAKKATEKDSSPTLSDVMETWTLLKKDVSEIEDKNILLKATLSKLKLQTKRQSLASDRIKKESKLSTSNENQNISCIRSESVLEDRMSDHDAVVKKKKSEDEVIDDGEYNDIDDIELREIAMENFVLQQLRRGLINRAKTAIATRNEHIRTVVQAKDSATLLRARVALAVPSIVPLPEGQDTIEHRNLRCLVNDLRNSKLSILCAEAVLEHGFHVGPLQDAIYEDKCLIKFLKHKLDEVKQKTVVCKNDNQDSKEKLNILIEEKNALKTRETISTLTSILSNLRTKKCLDDVRHGTTNTEREIARFNIN